MTASGRHVVFVAVTFDVERFHFDGLCCCWRRTGVDAELTCVFNEYLLLTSIVFIPPMYENLSRMSMSFFVGLMLALVDYRSDHFFLSHKLDHRKI